jgi:type IV pilus assembly protein PilB
MADDLILNKNIRLLDFLVSGGFVKEELVAGVRADFVSGAKMDLETSLTDTGIMKIEDFTQAKAQFLNVPYTNLSEIEISDDVLNSIPPEVAEHYKVICFDKQGKQLSIGIVDPENFRALEAIDFWPLKILYKLNIT